MNEMTVGVRELKNKMSEYLRRMKSGEIIVITERGKPIGQLGPMHKTLEDRMRALAASGFLEWSGKKLKPHKPSIINTSDRQISDLIVEDRR